jgi:hypothetical protein
VSKTGWWELSDHEQPLFHGIFFITSQQMPAMATLFTGGATQLKHHKKFKKHTYSKQLQNTFGENNEN